MDLVRHYEYVLAVVDTGSFTDAAIELGITQPPLSQGVRRLEERWGLRLLDRNARGVTLTAAGRRLVPTMRSLVSEARVLDQRARLLSQEVGDLTLGVDPAVESFAAGVVARWRAGLDLAVRPRTGTPEQLVDAVRSHEIDVAIIQHPCDVDGVLSGTPLVLPTTVILPGTTGPAPRRSAHGIPIDLPLALRPRTQAPAAHDLLVHEARRAGHNAEVVEIEAGHVTTWVSAGSAWSLLPDHTGASAPEQVRATPAPPRLRLRAVVVGRTPELVQQVQAHAESLVTDA